MTVTVHCRRDTRDTIIGAGQRRIIGSAVAIVAVQAGELAGEMRRVLQGMSFGNARSNMDRIRKYKRRTRPWKWLWLGALLSFACSFAFAETPDGRLAIAQISSAAKESSACPSTDFTAFFNMFSERADLQRRYTRLPLEFGVLDTDLLFKKRKIRKFVEIPQYRPRNGAIISTLAERQAEELEIRLTTSKSARPPKGYDPEDTVTNSNNATATVFDPETGFRVHYRFRMIGGCWFLIGISDRSI
jgi:hypothetical protein